MPHPNLNHCASLCAVLLLGRTVCASAQTVETVGSRALGMGGAFVAVANDSSATWWNPAGLAAGPFLDLALGHAVTEMAGDLPVWRGAGTWFALGTPPFGFSYYRLRITDIRPFDPTAEDAANREDSGVEVPSRSVAASQLGITLVQTLIPGLHAGATLKYVRASVRAGREDGSLSATELLDRGDALEGGEADSAFDVDVGLIGVAGALRVGLLVRNAREPEFESDAGVARLERQVRAGVAYDGSAIGRLPLTVAFDADLRTTSNGAGERRVVALGAEQWFLEQRLAVRGGARFNMAGAEDWAATGGLSVAVRAGLFLDAHVVRGGAADERGWGVAARVSF